MSLVGGLVPSTEAHGSQFPRSGLFDTAHTADAAPQGLKSRLREDADDCPNLVAVLNDRWRVIRCRDDRQWILQRKGGLRTGNPVWASRSYCVTSAALLRCSGEHAGAIDADALEILRGLPERIKEGRS